VTQETPWWKGTFPAWIVAGLLTILAFGIRQELYRLQAADERSQAASGMQLNMIQDIHSTMKTVSMSLEYNREIIRDLQKTQRQVVTVLNRISTNQIVAP
jgi:hypothetical protein